MTVNVHIENTLIYCLGRVMKNMHICCLLKKRKPVTATTAKMTLPKYFIYSIMLYPQSSPRALLFSFPLNHSVVISKSYSALKWTTQHQCKYWLVRILLIRGMLQQSQFLPAFLTLLFSNTVYNKVKIKFKWNAEYIFSWSFMFT